MWTRVINRGPGSIDLFRSQLNRLFSDFDDSYAGFGKNMAPPHIQICLTMGISLSSWQKYLV